jgi:hypothetical protein
MKAFSLLLLAAGCAAGCAVGLYAQDCIRRPCVAATNFADDLLGPVDTRPGCWGRADYAIHRITFRPPEGYRVRILRASGDLVSWARGRIARGAAFGVLLGLQTTAPEGSVRADLAADNTMLYVQDTASTKPTTRTFNEDVSAGSLLEPDHVLIVKLAAWLNETERAIHMEATLNLTYRWERETSAADRSPEL